MAILKVYPPVRPMDPAYSDLLNKSLPPKEMDALRTAIEKYNKICVAAAEELNDFCINVLKLPPEGTSMKK